jgi:tetratricopeptide (TPR) repeat protein/tRNA A-37 threonylcarbamoyl transferase component Bud32
MQFDHNPALAMSAVPDRLQKALADRYTIERELGAGGMATVYLAEDVKHRRKVAVKVLRPELAATLGPDRFNLEIKIAAQLSHPHILPVLDSGDADGFLYYVMPFIEGESLRDRLAREGELPLPDAVRILAEVTDALAHAHRRGVVHRDMKPDNVMISGRHALVMDFGVAKAVSDAGGLSGNQGAGALTTAGMALGTPAYMAPEQAAADPNVDHRADLYALGAMGYEMLTGRPPFTGRTPQEVLAAHVTQKPEPVTARRAAIPGALGIAIMRCLEKRAADRYQSAEALLAVLEPIGTPSGGMTPTQTAPYPATQVDPWYGHPFRVGGMFLVAALAVLGVVYFLTIQLGLPDWVIRGAVALLAAGLPIMVATGLTERRRAVAHATGVFSASGETGIRRLMTWRKAMAGGGLAFGALAIGVAVYTAMRLLGIGPVGTLMASGHLKASDKLIVADFANRSSDSTLGPSVTEAFRIDLAQSPLVSLMSTSALGDALDRMKQPRNQPLTADLARELAQREGAKAVVAGEISPVGKGFVLTARLLAALDGSELVALRETADDDGQILKAIDRLSKSMRERIGESLRTIRANDPLEQVTTASFEALRLYSEGVQATNQGENERAISLLKQAVELDSGFAMAWRKLAVAYANSGGSQALMQEAATRAYVHRDRLPEMERDQADAFYYWRVEEDDDKAIEAYRAVLHLSPDNLAGLVNLANILNGKRRYPEAESLGVRAIAVAPTTVSSYDVTLDAQLAQGKMPVARATMEQLATHAPTSPALPFYQSGFYVASGSYDSALAVLQQAAQKPQDASDRAGLVYLQGDLALLRGQLGRADGHWGEAAAIAEQRKLPGQYIDGTITRAVVEIRFRGNPAGAVKLVAAALARYPLAGIPAADRPYVSLAIFYAVAGQPAVARRYVGEYEATTPAQVQANDNAGDWMAGYLALAERRPSDAVAAFRQARARGSCTNCAFFELGQSYDLLKQPDSALVEYTRVIETPNNGQGTEDLAWNRPRALRRLGELYEEKGDRARALDYYGKFVALWKDADPEFQPQIKDVKARMAKLAGER